MATKEPTKADSVAEGGTANEDAKNSKRLSKTTACLPIVYGSIAFYLGKKADEFSTHEWTLFVRGPHHEDLSPAISKVIFQLHASFAQPTRELTQPPFEVTERGWGEFEAQIRIVWSDPTERPTVVSFLWRISRAVATDLDHIETGEIFFPNALKKFHCYISFFKGKSRTQVVSTWFTTQRVTQR